MDANIIQERQQAHALLDLLHPDQLNAVRSLLEVMVDPRQRLTHSPALAPMEAEELKPEMVMAIEQAQTSLARGEAISHEELLREFGLSQ